MNIRYSLFVVLILIFSNCSRHIQVIRGHAHNDYEHKNPLKDALKNGFSSVEVDVHLVAGNLYVSHHSPQVLNPTHTLESLYLEPLQNHISKHNGMVYPNYHDPFYLMVDFKTAAQPTYEHLKSILSNYLSIISTVHNGVEKKGAVTVFISGNRPLQEILNDELKLALIDGRPDDLDKNIPEGIMPVISDNYFKILSWNGSGVIKANEIDRFKLLLQNTHSQGKKLRLWAAPDNAIVWKFLLDNGVDLINTDRLKDFKKFILKYEKSKKRNTIY